MKKTKEFVFARRGAEVPAGLDTVSDFDSEMAERRVHGVEFSGRAMPALKMESSVLERCRLAESAFGTVFLKDVRLVGCDLANVTVRGLTLIRVEFVDCRMTGFTGGEVEAQDVLFSECDGRYAQFRFSKLNKGVEFDACQLEDADFGGTDLTGSVFRGCNLGNVEMGKSKLGNADLRGSRIEGLQVGAESLRGATVDASQAMQFALLLGIRIL